MGRVISMQRWLERRAEPREGRAEDDVSRLERAVARLEPLLDRGRKQAVRVDLETELLAVSGAVSLGRYDEAARRAERLADRLGALHRRPG